MLPWTVKVPDVQVKAQSRAAEPPWTTPVFGAAEAWVEPARLVYWRLPMPPSTGPPEGGESEVPQSACPVWSIGLTSRSGK